MAGLFGGLFGNGGGIAHGANGAQAVAVTPPQQQQTTNPAAGNATGDAGAPATGAAVQGSPLDALKAFWDTPKDAEGKPLAAAVDPTSTDIFNFDPVKVSESARKLNFTSDLNPELVQKALGGDAQAFMDVLNHATQTAFTAATLNTGKLINQSHNTNNERVKSTLPTSIKQVQLDQTATINPILQHEAAQPLVAALKKMAFAKDPSANPADVTKQVEALLVGLGTAMAEATPEAETRRSVAKAGEQDWSSFLD